MNPPKRRGCSVIGYLAILFAASLVAAPSDGAQREYPPSVAVAGAGLHRGASHERDARPAARAASAPARHDGGTPPRTASEPIAPSGEHLATRQGTWAYAKPSHGPRYLAIPEGPGILVTVCGPADCLDRVSTDAGPALFLQRAGRIGDLSAVDFEVVCGVPRSAGLCSGSYTIVHGAATLPPTDSAGAVQ